MEAPIETTVSAPETNPETPSVEPQVPEPQAPVNEPIPAEPSTPDTVPTESKETTPENPIEQIPAFDEKALEGILDEIAASNSVTSKFTFKEDIKTEVPQTPNNPAPSADEKKE